MGGCTGQGLTPRLDEAVCALSIMVDVITILLLSILAGLLGSLVGLGGSLITTPALVALGVPVKYAIAAGGGGIFATSSGSASSFRTEKRGQVKASLYLEM